MTWVAQPALAAPSLTMSEPVFVNDDAQPVSTDAFRPSVATDGHRHLVTYFDYDVPLGDYALVGRIMGSWANSGDTPFDIDYVNGVIVDVALGFDGTSYVVTWVVNERESDDFVFKYRRFTPGGTPEGETSEIARWAGPGPTPRLALAATDSAALVALCTTGECKTWLLEEAGATPTDTIATAASVGHPALAYSNGVWLLAASSEGRTDLAQLSSAGEVVDQTRVMLAAGSHEYAPSVVAATNGFALAFHDGLHWGLARVGFDGVVVKVPITTAAEDYGELFLVPTPFGFAVIYTQHASDGIYSASYRLLSADLAAIGPPNYVAYDVTHLRVTSYAGSALAVYHERDINSRALGRVFSFGDEIWILPAYSLARGYPLIEPKALAATATHWLLLFQDTTTARFGAGIFDKDGKLERVLPELGLIADPYANRDVFDGYDAWLFRSGNALYTLSKSGDLTAMADFSLKDKLCPRIAASPNGWLIVHLENDHVSATRLDSRGISLGSRVVGTSPSCPSAAFDGKDYRVAWVDGKNVVSARLPTTGAIAEPAVEPLFAPNYGESASNGIAFDMEFTPSTWWALIDKPAVSPLAFATPNQRKPPLVLDAFDSYHQLLRTEQAAVASLTSQNGTARTFGIATVDQPLTFALETPWDTGKFAASNGKTIALSYDTKGRRNGASFRRLGLKLVSVDGVPPLEIPSDPHSGGASGSGGSDGDAAGAAGDSTGAGAPSKGGGGTSSVPGPGGESSGGDGPPAGGQGDPSSAPSDDGDCSCRLGRLHAPGGSMALLALSLGFALRRARRR
jgi:hypothetical protein